MKRHPNGHGLVTENADIAAKVWLDRESLASGHCSIDSGAIAKSVVHGDSVVVNCKITSAILNCNRVTDSFIWASQLGPRVVVRSSHLEQVTLSGPIMAESATLIGPWTLEIPTNDYLSDYVRISGKWERAPRYFAGNRFYITEAENNSLYVGCKLRSFDWWLAHYGLGQRLGENAAKIKEFIEQLIASPCPRG